MKTRVYLCTCALLLVIAGVGLAADEVSDYSVNMKAGVAANGALNKALAAGDLAAAATSAQQVQDAFAKIEAFWTMRGAADAQGFAKNVMDAAKASHDAAAAGNKDAATAAAKMITANCGMCHMAHRDKAADGSYTIK